MTKKRINIYQQGKTKPVHGLSNGTALALYSLIWPDGPINQFCQDLLNSVIWKVADRIQILGSGSDHSAFAFYAGVPAVFLRFEPDTQKYKGKH
jgi:hypothetical protein